MREADVSGPPEIDSSVAIAILPPENCPGGALGDANSKGGGAGHRYAENSAVFAKILLEISIFSSIFCKKLCKRRPPLPGSERCERHRVNTWPSQNLPFSRKTSVGFANGAPRGSDNVSMKTV